LRRREDLLWRALLDDLPLVEEQHAVGHLARKPHLVRDHQHRHPALSQLDHDVEHLFDHLGIERRGWLVEKHNFGLHRQRAGDRHALLLAARELAGIFAGLLGDADALQQLDRGLLGPRLRPAAHPDRRQRDVLQHRQVREQVELLEDHADLAADGLDIANVVGQLNAVDDDLAALMILQAVDTANKGRFPRARWAKDHHHLAFFHRCCDALERMEIAIPLMNIAANNHLFGLA
jgi:hypothetical protein